MIERLKDAMPSMRRIAKKMEWDNLRDESERFRLLKHRPIVLAPVDSMRLRFLGVKFLAEGDDFVAFKKGEEVIKLKKVEGRHRSMDLKQVFYTQKILEEIAPSVFSRIKYVSVTGKKGYMVQKFVPGRHLTESEKDLDLKSQATYDVQRLMDLQKYFTEISKDDQFGLEFQVFDHNLKNFKLEKGTGNVRYIDVRWRDFIFGDEGVKVLCENLSKAWLGDPHAWTENPNVRLEGEALQNALRIRRIHRLGLRYAALNYEERLKREKGA